MIWQVPREFERHVALLRTLGAAEEPDPALLAAQLADLRPAAVGRRLSPSELHAVVLRLVS